MHCGPRDLPMSLHNVLNVLTSRMGRLHGSHLKDNLNLKGLHVSNKVSGALSILDWEKCFVAF